MLALEDLKGLTEDQVIEHLATGYSGICEGYSSSNTQLDIDAARSLLQCYDVLIAYESVGNWGMKLMACALN